MKSVDRLLMEALASLPRRWSPPEVFQQISAGTLVVDIRGDEQQRRDGLLPGAVVIRRNVLEWRCDPLSPWRHPSVTNHGQKIILFCHEGYQSVLAAANLQTLGLHLASDMEGGFVAWRVAGLPTKPYDLEERT